jgi:hypothetical protein
MKKWLIIPFSVLLFLIGCTQRDKHGNILDTPTSGSVKIAVDESL